MTPDTYFLCAIPPATSPDIVPSRTPTWRPRCVALADRYGYIGAPTRPPAHQVEDRDSSLKQAVSPTVTSLAGGDEGQ
jgi:hypothetical protein